MGQISACRELTASADDVWDLASNPNNFEKWLTLHVKWKSDVPAEFTPDSQVTEVISMMGMPNTVTWTVDEVDAPRKLAISGTGMAGVQIVIELGVTRTDAGSKFEIQTSFKGQMIVGALGKAIEKQGAKELAVSLDNFEALLS